MQRTLKNPPSLCYDRTFDCWAMWLNNETPPASELDASASYCMLIKYAYNGDGDWNEYRFLRWSDGEYVELYTVDQYHERVRQIEENEGTEVARVWREEQDIIDIVCDDHPVFQLRKHWEAMLALDLFVPSVTHFAFQNMRGLDKQLIEKLDAIRALEMEEAVEELAREAAEANDEWAWWYIVVEKTPRDPKSREYFNWKGPEQKAREYAETKRLMYGASARVAEFHKIM